MLCAQSRSSLVCVENQKQNEDVFFVSVLALDFSSDAKKNAKKNIVSMFRLCSILTTFMIVLVDH